MKINKILWLLILTLALLLAACDSSATESSSTEPAAPEEMATDTLAPTPEPATGLSCLSGTWELVNIENYMNSVVPSDLAGTMEFVDSSGTAGAEFAGDGTYSYHVDDFRVQYAMDMGAGAIPMEVIMQGEGNGIYEAIDDHTLTFTQLDDSGLTITITLAGEPFDIGLDDAVSFFGSPDTVFQFDCSGDSLLTYPPIDGALPVEYARVD